MKQPLFANISTPTSIRWFALYGGGNKVGFLLLSCLVASEPGEQLSLFGTRGAVLRYRREEETRGSALASGEAGRAAGMASFGSNRSVSGHSPACLQAGQELGLLHTESHTE